MNLWYFEVINLECSRIQNLIKILFQNSERKQFLKKQNMESLEVYGQIETMLPSLNDPTMKLAICSVLLLLKVLNFCYLSIAT